MSRVVLTTALPLLLALPASAQSFNIDVGSVLGVPSSAYGAGAAQPGTWNQMTDGSGLALVGLFGQPTAASVSALAPNFAFWSNNPGTTGDDELLLDDSCDGAGVWTFSGLVPGDYQILTYAWAPDSPAYKTLVSVQGSSDPDQIIGGTWSGAHVNGVTYALHNVSAPSGQIVVTCSAWTTYSTVNGFQLIDLGGGNCPTPAVYCTPKTSSSGCVPALSSSGIPSASAGSGFLVQATQIERNRVGVLFYGKNGQASIPFQGGYLCAMSPILRTPPQGSGGATTCAGTFAFDFNQYVALGGDPGLVAGAQVFAQYWFRDPPDPVSNTGLTGGIEFTLCP